jgi:phospholipid/cholesterol/gamma-HCH transport system substrate-binding protein
MSGHKSIRAAIAAGSCVALMTSGCAFDGVNSLPLPGAVGRGSDATTYHVEITNVAMLEPNSPVMMNDVVIGSVRKLSVKNWRADIEFSVKPGVDIPANVVASVGQTSLLGSMHLAINSPVGQAPGGKLPAGATIPLNDASTYPTTEQTLSSLAAVVNGGGLGQIGDVIHNFSTAMNGRQGDIRDLLTRLNNFVGVLDAQRDNIVSTIQSLNRLSSTFAGQRDVLTRALNQIPPAVDVLIRERPRLTTALEKLGTFSDTANTLVNTSKADLVTNLRNLDPALKALVDVGPRLDQVINFIGTFPFTQSFIDRGIRGDYMNLFAYFDFTIPKMKKTLMLGTRWGQEGTPLVPAPGEPYSLSYTYDPLKTGVAPPPGAFPPAPAPAEALAPPPPATGPVLPVSPPPPMTIPGAPVQVDTPPPGSGSPIFAGPFGAQADPAPPATPPTGSGG